ncbi:MAG TPA: hypothetical protein VFB83_03980 [Propionibacteriaceae bacterium]|nr:hypothetical protein [Propionibacteriaceae bacterium]
MRTTFQEIQRLLAAEGVIARRDHPELDTTLRYLLRRGDLARVLPGIYSAADRAASQQTRIRALSRFDPDAILVGAVAARISFWPDLRVDMIECAVRHSRAPQAGYRFTRRHIPPELVVNRSGLPHTSPALTALDLCAIAGGDAIDQALHTGAEVFETDRWRQNSLILDGWCVLRFTWTMIEEQPEKVIAMVREAIEMLAAKQS